MAVTIIRGNVPGYKGPEGTSSGTQQIALECDHITAITPIPDSEPSPGNQDTCLDCGQDWISLGGCDLQINGALGLAFPDVTPETLPELDTIGRYLWQAGIDEYLPTLVTTSLEKFQGALKVFEGFMKEQSPAGFAAQVLGLHLEGPCLNPNKRGAHPQEFLLPLSPETLEQVLGPFSGIVRIMTVAPELDPTGGAIAQLQSQGIHVSLGHSLANAAQANQAFDQGAHLVTHAFNAMPGLHHREPGLLGAALVRPGVSCGVIADGEHICPTMLQLLLRAAADHLFLVSDALAPLGLPNGTYPWDSRQIHVTQGTARLPDGTLAGTTRSLLEGALNLVNWGLCDIETAISLATIAPRRALGRPSGLMGASVQQLLRWQQVDGQWQCQRLLS
ncbi:N-acetylglucosamine-6-phosphate deacetylase [Sodalinema gerasimenkoae]|uniref:N-acetylglucosamine-6-phosphate deacetylase n=1 Tax=Sodalinema gerasimenkoae TaxID=2862348 RepID=UPI00135CA022|nr:N-acetylglucosamine-6-phosphate deacetylase [Sodalinema gerasimenkoae]